MKLIFVRHGEPLKEDYGIAKKGIDEMKLLGQFFRDNYDLKKIYSATSQRASESVDVLNNFLNLDVEYFDWLSEFKFELATGGFPWEYPPEYWINDDTILNYKNVLSSELLRDTQISNRAQIIWNEFDKIIERHGYIRENNIYLVKESNYGEVVFLTHFATMAVILSHLLNISLIVALNMFFMAPSSYTVFATEEIIQGKAIFRCLEMGSTKHLYGKNYLKSEYGRQAEIR